VIFGAESKTESFRANFVFARFEVLTVVKMTMSCCVKMETLRFYEMLLLTHESTRRHNPEEHLQFRFCSYHSSVTPTSGIPEAHIKHYFSRKVFTVQNIHTSVRMTNLWVKK
jgi:hypothetical protein